MPGTLCDICRDHRQKMGEQVHPRAQTLQWKETYVVVDAYSILAKTELASVHLLVLGGGASAVLRLST